MVDVYTVGQVGIEFAGQITDNDNAYDIRPIDLENYSELYVRFFRPDGTNFKKTAAPRDENSLNDTEIVYENDGDSIIDQKGDWSFTVGVKYSSGSLIESPYRQLFWVV